MRITHSSSTPRPVVLLLGAVALVGCQSGKLPGTHGPNRLTFTKQVYEKSDLTRRYDGFSGSSDFDGKTDVIGLTYERFVNAYSSVRVGLQERNYKIAQDPFSSSSSEGLELLLGGRFYGRVEKALQPFFGGGIRMGDGVEIMGALHQGAKSHTTYGAQAGGGVAYFHPSGFTAELGAQFEFTSIDTDLSSNHSNEDEYRGRSVWLGVGWTF